LGGGSEDANPSHNRGLTIRRLKIAAAAIVVFALTAIIISQQAQVRGLVAEGTVLREQLAQAVSAREKHDPVATAEGPSQDSSQEQFRELMRLRGEVGVLRGQLAEAAKPHSVGRLAAKEGELARQLQPLQEPDQAPDSAQIEAQEQKVEAAKQEVKRLLSALNVPEKASQMDSAAGLDTTSLKQYWPYFEAKKELEQAVSLEVTMRLMVARARDGLGEGVRATGGASR
jgi:hypothetical protein